MNQPWGKEGGFDDYDDAARTTFMVTIMMMFVMSAPWLRLRRCVMPTPPFLPVTPDGWRVRRRRNRT